MYKYSFDYQTIQEAPAGLPLFQFLLSQVQGGIEVVKCTFTEYDLRAGSVLRLLIRRKGKLSLSVIVGKDLTVDHFAGTFDAFGVYQGAPTAHAWVTAHGLDCDGHNSGHLYSFPNIEDAESFAKHLNESSDGLQYIATTDFSKIVDYCESFGKSHANYQTY